MGIRKTHKRNLELIKKYNFEKRDEIKLKKDYHYYKKGDIFTISHIHKIYGWINFIETEQLPQEVEEILNLIDIDEFRRLKIINNLN